MHRGFPTTDSLLLQITTTSAENWTNATGFSKCLRRKMLGPVMKEKCVLERRSGRDLLTLALLLTAALLLLF